MTNWENFYYDFISGDLEKLNKYINDKNNLNSILWSAISEGHLDMVNYLLEHGADPNKSNINLQLSIILEVETYLFELEVGRLENDSIPSVIQTELLIKHGADINFIYNKETPLDTAIRIKHPEAEKLLKSLGAKTSKELEENNKNDSYTLPSPYKC